MSFFDQLTEKPWGAVPGAAVDLRRDRAFALPKSTLGLRILLAVITVLFSLLVVAYADRMAVADWRPLPDPWVLWLNTAMLICSSAGLQWALMNAHWGQSQGVKAGLLAAGVFAFAFLAGQLWAWQQMAELGYFAAANPANGFFYLVTALHGLHLLGGLVALGRVGNKVLHGIEAVRAGPSVELCAAYWHFLLLLWLILFGLLLFT